MTTAIFSDQRCLLHDQRGHPERAARLHAITEALDGSELRGQLLELPVVPVGRTILEAVHTPEQLALIQHLAEQGGGQIDGDTYVGPHSWQAALLATGAAVQATEAVVRGQATNAFALGRPPGHHATARHAMGFCLLNHIAIAARYAVEQLGLSRVAIVDWDVHHGNGTQDIFYEDGQVLFCSLHAAPLFPGSGAAHEIGVEGGYGTTLNLPLPYRVGDQGYAAAFERCILPALQAFRPELLLVSAGYDAHWADPLGPMSLSSLGFAALATMLRAAAESCGGRLVCVLEGGYDLDALAQSVLMTLRVLLGRDPGEDRLGPATGAETPIGHLLDRLVATHPLLRDG